MNTIDVRLRVKTAWWVMPFIHMCGIVAALPGVNLNIEKVTEIASRGVSVKVDRV